MHKRLILIGSQTKRKLRLICTLAMLLMLGMAVLGASMANAVTWTSVTPGTGGCGTTTIDVPNDHEASDCYSDTTATAHGNWNDADCWTRDTGTGAPTQTISSGDTVVINHHVYYNISSDLTNNGTVNIVGGVTGGETKPKLHVPDGRTFFNTSTANLNMFNAEFRNWRYDDGCAFKRDPGNTEQGGSVKNQGGVVYVLGSIVENAEDWASEGATPVGIRVHEKSCIFTGQNYSTNGADQLIEVCAILGTHNSGNFTMGDSASDVYFDALDINLIGGSGTFELKGTVSGSTEGISYIEATSSGQHITSDSATSGGVNLQEYCIGGSLTDDGNVINGPQTVECSPDPDPFPCTVCGPEDSLSVNATGDCPASPPPDIALDGTPSDGFTPGTDPDDWGLVYGWTATSYPSGSPPTITHSDTSDASASVTDTSGLADGLYAFTLKVTDLVGFEAEDTVWVEISSGNPDCNPTVATIGAVGIEMVSVTDFADKAGYDSLSDEIDPDNDGLVAVFRWITLAEHGTIGFYVERQTENGKWVRLSEKMLPGLITAPMGGEYQLADPSAASGNTYKYRLIEQEATGNQRRYGPYTLEVQ